MLSSVAFRVGYSSAGVVLLVGFPLVLLVGRIEVLVFDGASLRRRGPYAWLQANLLGTTTQLPVAQLEIVITEVIHLPFSLTRYRFRTILAGAGFEAVIFSNTTNYQSFVTELFAVLDESKLDFHSTAWRRYGAPSPIASVAELLDDAHMAQVPSPLLRIAANHLTLIGQLKLALRYFGHAYGRDRGNPHLLCEMGYFFRRFALSEHPRWQLRAAACLRLAARLARHEPRLLERIGEAYCELFDFVRAERCFRRAIEIDRTLFRAYTGLAEIAFRDGQLARVAHYYYAAAHGVADAALRRRAQREARYYERLSQDDDYLEAEVRRITFLHHVRQMRTVAGYVFFLAWLVVGVAGRLSPDLQDGGLAIMGSSGLAWLGLSAGLRWRRKRADLPGTVPSD
ncbi:MAG: tetratricopeptide repeat protein [Chloracidobacterium sp.]